MNVIFIYGPPAAGKLTVARALSELTNYPVLDNHSIINILTPIFPRTDKTLNEVRSRLGKSMRVDIFHQAAKAGVNLITTFGAAGAEHFDYNREVQAGVESGGGRVCFVQLLPSEQTLLERVETGSRKALHKINTADHLRAYLTERPSSFEKFPDVDHLTIDNSSLSPAEAAKQIINYYNLAL